MNATAVGFAYLLLILIVASTSGFLEAALSSLLATLLFNSTNGILVSLIASGSQDPRHLRTTFGLRHCPMDPLRRAVSHTCSWVSVAARNRPQVWPCVVLRLP